jgi:hypothetical protein
MLPNYNQSLSANFVIDLTDAMYREEGGFFTRENLRDCLSSGQLLSKLWCLEQVSILKTQGLKLNRLHHLGCWHGLLSKYLDSNFVTLVETDLKSLNLAGRINPKASKVLEDATVYCKNYVVEDYDCVLNTSCEHMEDTWITYLNPKTLVIAQSTNFVLGEGHINTKTSLDEFQRSLNLSKVLYCDSLEFPMYDRYMIIGYK